MNQVVNGAALRRVGGGAMPPAGAPSVGPSGATLASVAPPPQQPPPQPPMPAQEPMPAGRGGASGEIDQAIAAVLEAAQSVGFELPAEGVGQEQLPQVYAQILAAAAQSEMGQSPDGRQLIEGLAQALGVPSPFGGGGEPGMEAAPAMLPGGAMPGGSMR